MPNPPELKPESLATKMLEFLETGRWTTRQISDHTKCCIKNTACEIARLRKRGLVYRCGYEPQIKGDRGGPQALYTAGCDEDVEHPGPVPDPRGSSKRKPKEPKKPKPAKQPKKKQLPVSSVFQLGERYK